MIQRFAFFLVSSAFLSATLSAAPLAASQVLAVQALTAPMLTTQAPAVRPSAVQQEEEFDLEKDYDKRSRQVVARDEFPVFDDPEMISASEAVKQGFVKPNDLVIGIAYKGEAKAYPVPIMGVHELGNDTIGGKPVAIAW